MRDGEVRETGDDYDEWELEELVDEATDRRVALPHGSSREAVIHLLREYDREGHDSILSMDSSLLDALLQREFERERSSFDPEDPESWVRDCNCNWEALRGFEEMIRDENWSLAERLFSTVQEAFEIGWYLGKTAS